MSLASHRRMAWRMTSLALHMSPLASRLSPSASPLALHMSPLASHMSPLASHMWMRVKAQSLPLLPQVGQLAEAQLLQLPVQQLLALERVQHLSISLWFSSSSYRLIHLREQQQFHQGNITNIKAGATTAKFVRRTQK